MSLGEYPTVVAKIVAINNLGQQSKIVQLLQQHYSMEADDAREALQSLPFKLPVSFFTLKEGQTAVRELVGLGCEIKFRDLLDPEPEEEEEKPPEEPEALPEETSTFSEPVEPAPVEEGEAGEKQEEEEPEKPGGDWQRWVIKLGSYFILVSFLLIAYWFLALDRHWTTPEGSSRQTPLRDFSSTALGKLVSQIDERIKQMGSMDQFLKELPEKLEKEKVTPPQRSELSDHYHKKASQPRPKNDNIKAMRAIQMLKVALVANKRNQKAWKLLVKNYQERGMNHKVKKTQRSMMKAIGRDAMVKIYGTAVVEKLGKR